MGRMKDLYIDMMNERRGMDDMEDDEYLYEQQKAEAELQEYLQEQRVKQLKQDKDEQID